MQMSQRLPLNITSFQSIKQPNKWALHELANFPTHAVGNVCLMGDAAAATLPHQVRIESHEEMMAF